MRSFESNLAFVRACLAEWEAYERTETLFWTLSAHPPANSPAFLQMTLGNTALALDEMRAVEASLSPRDRTALTRVQTEWERRRIGRSVRLENKAVREVNSRIAQWRAYAADVLESGDLSEYTVSVRPRLCAVRLLEWLGMSPKGAGDSLAELGAFDAGLDMQMEQSPCVLGTEMAAIYPPTPLYRFLYRRPRQSKRGG